MELGDFAPEGLGHWILNGHELVEVDLLTWGKWLEEHQLDRIVRQEDVQPQAFGGGQVYWVSTVFLGLDHNWGDRPPLLFETMVFKKEADKVNFLDLYCNRYPTWEAAEAGHQRAVDWVYEYWADQQMKLPGPGDEEA